MKTESKPKRAGRPKRIEGKALERLTLNIDPKMKFGLELLARAQRRSLTQALEWAIKVGMNSQEVGTNGKKVGDVIDDVWPKSSESERILAIYQRAPELLLFEDLATCTLIDHSFEAGVISEGKGSEKAEELHGKKADTKRAFFLALGEDEETLIQFAVRFWDRLKEVAVSLSDSGKPLERLSLFSHLGYPKSGVKFPADAMRRVLEDPSRLPKP